jgi:hypothetical protein
MNYTVEWTPEALEELVEIWSDAQYRADAIAASRVINWALADDPLKQRFEVVQGKGTAVHAPLGVDFEIDQANRRVTVTSVWVVSEEFG